MRAVKRVERRFNEGSGHFEAVTCYYLDGKRVTKEEWEEALPDQPLDFSQGAFGVSTTWRKPVKSLGLGVHPKRIKDAERYAEKMGVPLLVEPEPGLLIETADQFLEFMRHIESPAVGLNFDIGHAYCVGDEPAETIPRVARYIRHFHLEDIAATRVHHHLVPGEGAIDFAATLRAIQAIGYDGWITIELYPYVDDPDAAASTARQRLLKILAAL